MNVWIDIDNPPQAQYLLPFRAVFEELGANVLVTARDNEITVDLVTAAGGNAVVVGSQFGQGRLRKATGVVRRAAGLRRPVLRAGKPDLVLSASRSAALLARSLGVPSFVILDYEFVETSLFRRLGAYLLFPAAIGTEPFLSQGFPAGRLLPFAGLKEDITFNRADRERHTSPDPFGERSAPRVLVRPPHETSHYFRSASLSETRRLLGFVAAHDAQLIFSPRHAHQRAYLAELDWRFPPIVLDRPLPTLDLLDHVDLVVTGGGTMAREAAYWGVPAYSVFTGPLGGVDRHLSELGRLVLLEPGDDFSRVRIERVGERSPLPARPALPVELARRAFALAGAG